VSLQLSQLAQCQAADQIVVPKVVDAGSPSRQGPTGGLAGKHLGVGRGRAQ
jgi:hypothetical protein